MVNDDFSTVVLNKKELSLLKRLKKHELPYSDTTEINALIKYRMANDTRARFSDGEGGFFREPDGLITISEKGLAYLCYVRETFIKTYLLHFISIIISALVLVVSVINLIFNVSR